MQEIAQLVISCRFPCMMAPASCLHERFAVTLRVLTEVETIEKQRIVKRKTKKNFALFLLGRLLR